MTGDDAVTKTQDSRLKTQREEPRPVESASRTEGDPSLRSGFRVSSFLQTTGILAVIAGLLAAAVIARGQLLDRRREAKLEPADVSRLTPVGAASVVLLGGFRGVAADILWLQATGYHDRRLYVEERGIIELITQIQPHSVSVWAFWALAISYDISVQEHDPRNQWRWVRDGVEFIEKGIAVNPESGDLWFYLGQLYRDKMSQDPYFEDACEREMGRNNFEEAATAYDRSRQLAWGPAFPFAPRMVDGAVFWSWLARAQQIYRRATLTDDLSFSPETHAAARPALDMCRKEAAHLLKRYPTDLGYIPTPARVEMVVADGYVSQIARLLAPDPAGIPSNAVVARARKVLDKAVSELDNYRSKYSEAHIEWVFVAKLADAWLRIPLTMVRQAGEGMSDSKPSVAVRARCRRLLQIAAAELDRVPEEVRKSKDYVWINGFVREGLEELLPQ